MGSLCTRIIHYIIKKEPLLLSGGVLFIGYMHDGDISLGLETHHLPPLQKAKDGNHHIERI